MSSKSPRAMALQGFPSQRYPPPLLRLRPHPRLLPGLAPAPKPDHPPHLLPPTEAEKPVLPPVGQTRGVHEVEGGKAPRERLSQGETPGRGGPPVRGLPLQGKLKS